MEYRTLGASGLVVSEICLGSWLTFGGGVAEETARRCVDRAFDLGVTFLDTANVYGRGAAEEVLGRVLADRPRDSYVLATKLFFPMSDTDRGLSRAQVEKQLDASLRRLRTDHVDLYQCHRFDPDTPLAETMEALTDAVRNGKVRYLGFSEWTAGQAQAAHAIPGVERFVSSQPQYSMLWRPPEREVLPWGAANGVAQIVWSPLAQGVLTGKYLPGVPPPAGTRMTSREMGWAMGSYADDAVLEAVQRLRPIAAGLGLTLAQLALAWVLRRPEVAAAIVGVTRPEQLDDDVAASGVRLGTDTLAAIDAALGDAAVR